MTNEQKEKIIELRKLGIGYRSIATAMNLRIQLSTSMYAITVELNFRTNQRVGITVAADATFEIGSGEMKM